MLVTTSLMTDVIINKKIRLAFRLMLILNLTSPGKRFLICNNGSSANGRSHKQTALLTAGFTKSHFSQLPYKLCIFKFL